MPLVAPRPLPARKRTPIAPATAHVLSVAMTRCPGCSRKIKSDVCCTYLLVSAAEDVALVWHFDCWILRAHGEGN